MSESLEKSAIETSTKNNGTKEGIAKAVEDSGNRADDVVVLEKAAAIRKATGEIIGKLDAYKDEIIEVTGGRDETGKPTGLTNEDQVANLMIVKGRGKELQSDLNAYTALLTKETEGVQNAPTLTNIALDAKDHPSFKDNKEQRNKDFSQLNFQATPMAAAIATISQFKTEVLSQETEALNALAQEVGAKQLKFDEILPMVNPEARVVAAGTKYKAKLFMAAFSSSIQPTMKVGGKSIPVTDGQGVVEFTAAGGGYNKDGLAKKAYKAEISLKLPGGRDTTYTKDIEYFVAKPVIQVQSAAIQALYLNCGNELNIQVPALGTQYNPSFTATGASTTKGAKKGLVTVIPTGKQVAITVSSAGNKIGTEKFNVRPVPKPDVEVRSKGKIVDSKRGFKKCPRQIQAVAISDATFKQFLPKDARYKVTEWEVTLTRNNKPKPGGRMRFTGTNADISKLAGMAKPGDMLFIDVKKVERMNFRNQREVVNMGRPIYVSVPIGG
ncbi:gliding motility-associated protein GldM [Aureibacter tunicatorum]|uniref:Gliding motility-associated protein GldM n=1 Tax=Aureibacter tunicatorum TaxID=866807 RepID=A0AAE4BQY0_9BACT|nr:gliding motility-associated protein GldM [Aureibacter tunicatorum]